MSFSTSCEIIHSSTYNITGRRLFLRLIPDVVQIIDTSFVVALPLPPKLQQIYDPSIRPQEQEKEIRLNAHNPQIHDASRTLDR